MNMRKITITESQFKKLISESARKLIREAQDYVLIKSIPVSKAIELLGGDESKLDTLSGRDIVSMIQNYGDKAPDFCSDPDELSDGLFWEDFFYALGSYEDNMGEQNFVLYAKTNGQPTNMSLGFKS